MGFQPAIPSRRRMAGTGALRFPECALFSLRPFRIAAEIRPVFAPISSSLNGKPKAIAFPGIHRIPARTPTPSACR